MCEASEVTEEGLSFIRSELLLGRLELGEEAVLIVGRGFGTASLAAAATSLRVRLLGCFVVDLEKEEDKVWHNCWGNSTTKLKGEASEGPELLKGILRASCQARLVLVVNAADMADELRALAIWARVELVSVEGSVVREVEDADAVEKRLGWSEGGTATVWPKGARRSDPVGYGRARKRLLKQMMPVPEAARIVCDGLVTAGLLPATPDEETLWTICGGPLEERAKCLRRMRGYDVPEEEVKLRGNTASRCLQNILAAKSSHKGTDVRLSQPLDPSQWPRRSIDPGYWKWRTALSFNWEKSSAEHINVLEMRAVLSTVRYKTREASSCRKRWFHLLDSQVCLSILAKGRTSSRRMTSVCESISAVLLAAGSCLFGCYVATHLNPADGPSRTRVRVRRTVHKKKT